jgi:hypothetical protein
VTGHAGTSYKADRYHALTDVAVVLDLNAEAGPRLVELLEILPRCPRTPIAAQPASLRNRGDLRLGVQQATHRLAVASVVSVVEGLSDLDVLLRHRLPSIAAAGYRVTATPI